jgi:hypothetical protein
MKLTWRHYVILCTAAGPALGAGGYLWGAPWLVKLGVSLCVLYAGLQVTWGMFRNPLWPLLGFGAGAGYGWLRGHPGLQAAAYGLLLAVAVDACGEVLALIRRTPDREDGQRTAG